MVSLLKLSEITEEGVVFQSPHDGSNMLLTPEKSIEIQNAIGDYYGFNLLWQQMHTLIAELFDDCCVFISCKVFISNGPDETLFGS